MRAVSCRYRNAGTHVAIVLLAISLSTAIKPLQAEPLDRQVAEWVLLMGGSVRVEGQAEQTTKMTDLPSQDFHLEVVDLVGANILPPDLQQLIGLNRLRVLNLPGPMWNPRSGARIDYSKELRHVAGIHTLEELTFSYTFLDSIKFQDDGLAKIAPLAPSLKLLSLENTNVRGHRLSPFTNLETLDLVSCPVDDEGMKQLAGLTKLRRLLLRDALISDEGLQYLRGLENIEHLDLGGTKITDAGVAHLGEMTKLRQLNLQGANLTDQGIGYLVGYAETGVAQSVRHEDHQRRRGRNQGLEASTPGGLEIHAGVAGRGGRSAGRFAAMQRVVLGPLRAASDLRGSGPSRGWRGRHGRG